VVVDRWQAAQGEQKDFGVLCIILEKHNADSAVHRVTDLHLSMYQVSVRIQSPVSHFVYMRLQHDSLGIF
jgi:hypothetical protein